MFLDLLLLLFQVNILLSIPVGLGTQDLHLLVLFLNVRFNSFKSSVGFILFEIYRRGRSCSAATAVQRRDESGDDIMICEEWNLGFLCKTANAFYVASRFYL